MNCGIYDNINKIKCKNIYEQSASWDTTCPHLNLHVDLEG